MATKTIKVTGIGYWLRVFPDNRDMTGYNDAYRECDGAYTVAIDLDEKSARELEEAGSRRKRSPKNGTFKFDRKHKDPRFDWAGGPPKVTKPDGTEWSYEDDGPIWNGSVVEITVDLYETKFGMGSRLRALHVVEPADPPEDRE
jgi:hypothetical protein